MPAPDTASALSGVLAHLSESCGRLGRLPDGGALLSRTRGLASEIEAALAAAEPPGPALAVTSLGTFRLLRDGRPVAPCPARRAVAVFRYLLTRPQHSAHKLELAGSIWPSATPKGATHSLHVAVSSLRQYLAAAAGVSGVTLSGGCYRIDPALRLADDAETFRQAAGHAARLWESGDQDAERAHVHAVACYTGDYCLTDLDFPWAAGERDRHLDAYLATLYRLGRMRLTRHRYDEAVDCMSRILERDCYREDVYFHLMLCYCRLGRRGKAVQQFLQCRRLLHDDLGIAPAPRLQRLYELIRDGDAADLPEPA